MLTKSYRITGGMLGTAIIAAAILAFLFTIGGETRCAQAQASCNVGDDETFAGDLVLQSGTAFDLTQGHSITADRAITWGDFAGQPTINTAAQTLTNKTINGGSIFDGVIGGVTPAAGTFTTLIGTTIDGPVGSVTPAAGTFTTIAGTASTFTAASGVTLTVMQNENTALGQPLEVGHNRGAGNAADGDSTTIRFSLLDDTDTLRVYANIRVTGTDVTVGGPGVDARLELEVATGGTLGGGNRYTIEDDGSGNSSHFWEIEGDEKMRLVESGALAFTVGSDPGTLANNAHIYSKDVATSAEIFIRDEAGNATQISPHDPVTNKWYFNSCNEFTGRCVEIDMEAALAALGALTGQNFIIETFIPVADRLDWDSVELAMQANAQASINAWAARVAAGADINVLGARPDAYTPRPKPAWLP